MSVLMMMVFFILGFLLLSITLKIENKSLASNT